METKKIRVNETLLLNDIPVIPLRGLVLYPNMLLQFDVGRKKSLLALSEVMNKDSKVFLVPQKNLLDEFPNISQLCDIGVVASVRQVLKQSGETARVLVEGLYRAKIDNVTTLEPFIKANIIECKEKQIRDKARKEAFMREVKYTFANYIEHTSKIAPDIAISIKSIKDASKLSDFISSNIMLDDEQAQNLLCELSPLRRLEKLLYYLSEDIKILDIEADISSKVRKKLDESQREYYLREQIKVVSQELGEGDDPQKEAQEYREKIDKLNVSEDIKEKLFKETDRLFKMPQSSHEANVIRNYLDSCLELPWDKRTKININIEKAQKVLDRDHYGLKKVKERVIDNLAVKQLSKNVKGQILCLAGPPGVGKTSIAKSIAKACGMNYVRLSLGGIKDESDIRGHRRTYIGAMPGRIIDAIKQAKSKNPLILLDEIDKLSNDFRGDPSSALLEVLDPEQNNSFYDHYIDLPFDLSEVMFITTANDINAIPGPLYDRMEVIELSSYTEEEKFQIAKRYLIPKQLKECGMNSKMISIDNRAIRKLIDGYTREAGVRTLERNIASLLSKCAKELIKEQDKKIRIDELKLETLLGPVKYKRDNNGRTDEIGVANGLAWTSVGGETLPVEVAVLKGSGHIEITGSLGDVMKESAKAAISCIRIRCDELLIDDNFYKEKDIHIHVPEGAVPKDGPSAGITMATAIASALTKREVYSHIAMTGEITLRGKVLPIGGLKEKTMAAFREKFKTVIIPKDNEPDLKEVEPVVLDSLKFIPVKDIDEVLNIALKPAKRHKISTKIIHKDDEIIPPHPHNIEEPIANATL